MLVNKELLHNERERLKEDIKEEKIEAKQARIYTQILMLLMGQEIRDNTLIDLQLDLEMR